MKLKQLLSNSTCSTTYKVLSVRRVEVCAAVARKVAEATVEDRIGTEVTGRRVGTSHWAVYIAQGDAIGTADQLVAK